MPEMKVPTPPSAPMMSIGPQPATPLTLEPDPVNPEPDDIPDPKVPETVKSMLTAPGTPFHPPSVSQGPRSPTTEPSDTTLPYDALLQGFCAHLLTRMQGMADDLATTTQQKVVEHMHNYHAVSMGVQQEVCTAVKAWIEATTAQPNEHAFYSLNQTLTMIQEKGLQLRSDPYSVDIEALAPQGYVCRIHIAKQDAGELVTEINNLMSWLVSQGYKPVG
jgi:hypothetical protein